MISSSTSLGIRAFHHMSCLQVELLSCIAEWTIIEPHIPENRPRCYVKSPAACTICWMAPWCTKGPGAMQGHSYFPVSVCLWVNLLWVSWLSCATSVYTTCTQWLHRPSLAAFCSLMFRPYPPYPPQCILLVVHHFLSTGFQITPQVGKTYIYIVMNEWMNEC